MLVREINDEEKQEYDRHVNHVIQSWEWGEFRKRIGLDLVRLGEFESDKLVSAFQMTFHSVGVFAQKIGYLPKGPMPNADMIQALREIGDKKNAAFIKMEPNVIVGPDSSKIIASLRGLDPRLVISKKSLFTKYNFILDITKSEQHLLAAMHPKTRYNIGVAQKKGVEVYDSTKDEDFEIYLNLYFETTKRQKYFGHTHSYHKSVWEVLKPAGMARVIIAKYQNKPLVAWMLLNFKDTLYYPYGGSSHEHKEVMASNLIAWEAIKLGKKLGHKFFDMWGALGPDARPNDPWWGFHRFKAGYGPALVEYIGTYDLVLKPALYNTLNVADRVRWALLRATRR